MILDWKTGKAKPNDFGELRCFSLLTFLNNRQIEKTKNIYFWLKNDSSPTSEIIGRERTDELLNDIVSTVDRIEESLETDVWPQKQSGLCKSWCDVVSCPKNGRR